MAKETFEVLIDCPPGGIRPIHVLVNACQQAGIPVPVEGIQWGRFMGEWRFYVKLDEAVMEKLFESLKLLYPGDCRYIGYSTIPDSVYEIRQKEGSTIKQVMEEWHVDEE